MKIVNKQETLFYEPVGNRVANNSDQLKDLYSFILSYVLIYRDHYLVTCTVVSVIQVQTLTQILVHDHISLEKSRTKHVLYFICEKFEFFFCEHLLNLCISICYSTGPEGLEPSTSCSAGSHSIQTELWAQTFLTEFLI